MADAETLRAARKDAAEGKAPSTQAGEFVREEIDHVREGKHGARSAKQAIAIGLSKARRAGVKLPPPDPSKTSVATRRKAELDTAKGEARKAKSGKASPKRSRATLGALKRETKKSVSSAALSKQAHSSANGRSSTARSAAARKAPKTRARNNSK